MPWSGTGTVENLTDIPHIENLIAYRTKHVDLVGYLNFVIVPHKKYSF